MTGWTQSAESILREYANEQEFGSAPRNAWGKPMRKQQNWPSCQNCTYVSTRRYCDQEEMWVLIAACKKHSVTPKETVSIRSETKEEPIPTIEHKPADYIRYGDEPMNDVLDNASPEQQSPVRVGDPTRSVREWFYYCAWTVAIICCMFGSVMNIGWLAWPMLLPVLGAVWLELGGTE